MSKKPELITENAFTLVHTSAIEVQAQLSESYREDYEAVIERLCSPSMSPEEELLANEAEATTIWERHLEITMTLTETRRLYRKAL